MSTHIKRRVNVPLRRTRADPRYNYESPSMLRPWKSDFGSRQRDWEDEVDRFRRDFFRNTPFEDGISREPRMRLFPEGRSYFEPSPDYSTMKSPERQMPSAASGPSPVPHNHAEQFFMEFELTEFQPEDISVKVEDTHLTVSAKQETNGNVREMSKTVEIPPHVDPEKLISHFSPNGILTVESLQPPCYESVQRSSQPPSEVDSTDQPASDEPGPSNVES